MRGPKKITPLPFQGRAVKKAQALVRTGKKTLVVSPGGSGKTVMIAMTVRQGLRKRKRILVISHRREILTQACAHLRSFGVKESQIGLIRGEAPPNLVRPKAPVQVASISALLSRNSRPRADLVLVDEAHHALAAGYRRVLQHYSAAQHVGFTATPHRLDGRGLGDFYEAMVVAARPSELIRDHLLLAEPIIYKANDGFVPDLKAVRVAMGDYVVSDLTRAVTKKALVGHIPENWAKRAKGRKTIGFAVSIEHSRSLTARCVANGIRAVHMDGTMSIVEQERILREFRAGIHSILFNCMVAAEGLDVPDCDAVILARPTKSLALYLQQSSRAMRRHGDVRPLILDHGRLWEHFGAPDGDRPWELLNGKASEAVLGAGTMKGCPKCHRVVSYKTVTCPGCGYRFPPSSLVRALPTELNVILQKYTERHRRAFERRVKMIAAQRGLSNEWQQDVLRIWGGFRAA